MDDEAGDSTSAMQAATAAPPDSNARGANGGVVSAVLVSDYRAFRELLVDAVASRDDVRWLALYESVDATAAENGIAPDGRTVVPDVVAPDVVVIDTDTPGSDAGQLVRAAVARWPSVPVVALTRDDRPATAVRLTQAGCAGLLTRTSSVDDIANAVRLAGNGMVLLSTAALDAVRLRLATDAEPSGPGWRSTTPRERDVLELLLLGESSKEIAAALHMSVHTCRSHVKSLMQKFGARSQVDLVARATVERHAH